MHGYKLNKVQVAQLGNGPLYDNFILSLVEQQMALLDLQYKSLC